MERFDFEHSGLLFRCVVEPDNDLQAPWIEHDGHGQIRSVSSYYGRPEKRPGEVIIYSERGEYWLYDVQATMQTARKDGWGLSEEDIAALGKKLNRTPTKGEVTAESVRRDMDYCRQWLQGDRFWEMIEVFQIDDEGESISESEYLGGIDSGYDSESEKYVRECAAQLASEIARAVNKETVERDYWASRDVATV